MAHSKKNNQTIDNVFKLSIWKSFKHRIPWLVLGLAGGLFSAKIVDSFEGTISQNIVLAGFIPLIVYMSDAVGTQMEAYVIRDFALHPRIKFIRYFLRHLFIVLLIGIILSTLLFVASSIWGNEMKISLVLSLALLFSVASSVFSGLILPRIFEHTRSDPANASGPIATILQDIVSVTIYLLIARWFLG